MNFTAVKSHLCFDVARPHSRFRGLQEKRSCVVHLLALGKHAVISADAAPTEVHEREQYVDMGFYTGKNNVRTSSALKKAYRS